jgi:hypothetical protein
MSAATPNPFAAYQPPPSAGPAAAPQSTVAGRVKLVSVIAIVLGSLGLATTLMGAVGQFVGTRMQSAFTSFQQPGLPPEMRDAQQAMQAEMQGIQIRFRPASIAVLIGHFAVSAALLWGGIQCLRRKLRGRPLLLVTCLATSVFEVIRGIVQVIIQAQTGRVATRYMERVISSTEDRAGVGDTLVRVSEIFMGAALLFTAALILAQLMFYIYTARLLPQPAVRAYFEEVQVF